MTCIKSVKNDKETWCGKVLQESNMHFKTIDQMMINEIYSQPLKTCNECVDKIVEIIK